MGLPDLTTTVQLPGSIRSRLNSETIRDSIRTAEHLANPLRPITELAWSRAQPFAIRRKAPGQVWHAGHVSAVLTIGDVAVVGTQTGGVYLIEPAYGAIPEDASHPSLHVSHDWSNPAVTCLAFGPDGPTSVFAGCQWGGALYVLELKPVRGRVDFVKSDSIPLPPEVGDVFEIAVLPTLRRIVLAASGGAWWSSVPESPLDAAGYHWRQGLGLPAPRTWPPSGIVRGLSGIAVGPDQIVVVGLWGLPPYPRHTSALNEGRLHGIYRGSWIFAGTPLLVFAPATIRGVRRQQMMRTSVASCEADRNVMYAVSAAADEFLLAALRSSDGGATWTRLPGPPRNEAGNYGDYNNCVTVSPYRPSFVAVGWRSSGSHISSDGGQTWTRPQTDATESESP
jgi:hypothetical protein